MEPTQHAPDVTIYQTARKVLDACGDCGGNGSACTEITATIPCSISSIATIVWVIGAGLNGGSETVCGLYNPVSGVMVNTTDLSVTSAIPDNVIKDDLPRLVTVIGTGFFNHSKAKIRCYYGHKESTEVIFINDTHLQCKLTASETCGDLFNDETVNLLGISPDCYSIDYQEIAIDLGYNATIGPGDSVGLRIT
ncbi:hypothetical protein OS493_031333 [Desmophyllum pertusum]|uniref:IPT/TIG domain-containing protein n=1 Tax=Desmophyllum pertusum TaxID=174260 RepID=A0A9W9YW87_9CNID|nr:hypothetical protein OS493_031333 [Desmophyllum pertusum]